MDDGDYDHEAELLAYTTDATSDFTSDTDAFTTDTEAYTTDTDAGASTAGEEEDEAADIFQEGEDPFAFLDTLQQHGEHAIPHYEELARHSRQVRKLQRRERKEQVIATAVEAEKDKDADWTMDDDEPSTSTARKPRGRSKSAAKDAAPRSRVRSKGSKGKKQSDVEDMEALQSELGFDVRSKAKRRRRERARRRAREKHGVRSRILPEEVSLEFGEGNIAFAQCRYDEAIDRMSNVVRKAPNHKESYNILGMAFENKGNMRKALDCYMIYAHLTVRDHTLWRRLAELSLQLGSYHNAIYCLNKVVRLSKHDMSARADRAALYATVGNLEKATYAFEKILQLQPGDVDATANLARFYFRRGQPLKAIELIEKHLEQYSETMDLTLVNILSELYIKEGRYQQSLQLLERTIAHCRTVNNQEPPLDLTTKAAVCHIYMDNSVAAERFLEPLESQEAADCADLFAEVGSAYAAVKRPGDALSHFTRVLQAPSRLDVDTIEKMLRCCDAVGEPEAAIDCCHNLVHGGLETDHPAYVPTYLQLVKRLHAARQHDKALQEWSELRQRYGLGDLVAPQHGTALLQHLTSMSEVQLLLGRREEMLLDVLPYTNATLFTLTAQLHRLEDMMRAYEGETKAHMLKRIKQWKHLKHLPTIGKLGAADAANVIRHYAGRKDRRKEHVREMDRKVEGMLIEIGALQGEHGVSILEWPQYEEEKSLFHLTVTVLLQLGRYDEAREIIDGTLQIIIKNPQPADANSRRFRDAMRLLRVWLLSATSELQEASALLKPLCNRWTHSMAVFNEWCAVYSSTGAARSMVKFASLLRARNPTSLPLMMVLGHALLLSGHHLAAQGEYFHAYDLMRPYHDPLLLLCIAVAFILEATTKACHNRHAAVLQGFAFLQLYQSARSSDFPEEVWYNFGRAAHQLGLRHLAVAYYHRVLHHARETKHRRAAAAHALVGMDGAPDAKAGNGLLHAEDAEAKMDDECMACDDGDVDGKGSLAMEAAHNLVMIYRDSGAHALAMQVMKEFLVV